MFKENKSVIAKHIEELLKCTRFGQDLVSVEYDNNHSCTNEYLIITWENGHIEMINVTADSGLAMIIDLAKWLKTK